MTFSYCVAELRAIRQRVLDLREDQEKWPFDDKDDSKDLQDICTGILSAIDEFLQD